MKEKFLSPSDFFEIIDVYEGLIKLRDGNYIKILEIEPLNLNLKSTFEKESILNSYKNFLKNLDSNIQIIIQSKIVDLNSHLEKIKIKSQKTPIMQELISDYFLYIQKLKNQSLYSKKFYIIISQKSESNKSEQDINKKIFKLANNIKESIEKCGNKCRHVEGIELQKTLLSFLSVRLSNNKIV